MSNVLLYPDSDTLLEQLHSLGYTKQPPENVTVYSSDNEQTVIIKDTSDNTIYDSENLTWVNDIDDLNLYNKIGVTTIYIGSDPMQCDGFSNSLYSETITYILYNDVIESIELLHNSIGLTDHLCVLYEVDGGEAYVWYDPVSCKYFNNITHSWSDDPPANNDAETSGINYTRPLVYVTSSDSSSSLCDNGQSVKGWIDSDLIRWTDSINGSSQYVGRTFNSKEFCLIGTQMLCAWDPSNPNTI